MRHNFKIGDKVRLKDHVNFGCKGKVLTIVKEVGDGGKYLHVTYEGVPAGSLPLWPNEIEYIVEVKVGEQLMFDFIEEIRNG